MAVEGFVLTHRSKLVVRVEDVLPQRDDVTTMRIGGADRRKTLERRVRTLKYGGLWMPQSPPRRRGRAQGLLLIQRGFGASCNKRPPVILVDIRTGPTCGSSAISCCHELVLPHHIDDGLSARGVQTINIGVSGYARDPFDATHVANTDSDANGVSEMRSVR